MGSLFKKMRRRIDMAKPGSNKVTGIDPGDSGSNTGTTKRRGRPGRRGANTPLGGNRARL